MRIATLVREIGHQILELGRDKWFSEFSGSWIDALNSVSGYSSSDISSQVHTALSAVRDGRAEHERDGVLFSRIEYSWPLLAILMSVAAKNHGKLRVIDFGGSLGSTYFQNREYLSQLDEVRWLVVEQESFVKLGREGFQSQSLMFETDLSRALEKFDAQIAIFSGSLQYVDSPAAILDKITKSEIDHLLLDRTPFHQGHLDLLSIQTVPPAIYTAQYPAWIFSLPRLRKRLEANWRMVSDFETLEPPMKTRQGTKFFWKGFHFARKAAT